MQAPGVNCQKKGYQCIAHQFTADGKYPVREHLKLEEWTNLKDRASEEKLITITRIGKEASSYERNVVIAYLFDAFFRLHSVLAFRQRVNYVAIPIEISKSPGNEVAIKILDLSKTAIVKNAEYEINADSVILRVWTDEESITMTEAERMSITYAPI